MRVRSFVTGALTATLVVPAVTPAANAGLVPTSVAVDSSTTITAWGVVLRHHSRILVVNRTPVPQVYTAITVTGTVVGSAWISAGSQGFIEVDVTWSPAGTRLVVHAGTRSSLATIVAVG